MKKRIVTGVSAIAALFMILYSGGILAIGSLFIPSQIYMAISLTAALVITFVVHRAYKTRKPIPWYDYILIVASIISVGYVAFNYKDILYQIPLGTASLMVTILFAIAAILILEATRRLIGIIFSVIVLAFLLQAMFSSHLPWLFFGKDYKLDWMAYALYIAPEGIFSTPLKVATTTLIAYLLFGNLLVVSGAGKLFVDLPMSLFGMVRGGPAKVSCVASAMLGTMTGSAIANVVTTGVFTIPLMKRVGYHADFAGAVEAVSSTGSQFTPPVMGGIIFIMAEWLQMPYYYICLAAAIPAALYYFNVYMVLDFEAARSGIKGLPKEELPSLKKTIEAGWFFFLPLALLIVLLAVVQMQANLAALYSSVSIILVSLFKKETRVGFRKLITALSDTFKQFLMVGIACAAAGLLVGALNVTGLGLKMGAEFLDLARGNLAIMMVLSAIAAFVMGMGMPSLPIYVILGVLLAPALVQSGVPALNAHFFIVVMAILHFITPPVALACFAAASISGGDMMKTGVQAVRIGILGFVLPFWFVYRPAIMLQGSAMDTVISVVVAIPFIVVLSAATMGYGLRKMNIGERIFAALAALLLLAPGTWNNILSITIIALLVVEQYILRRRDLLTAVSEATH